MRRLLLAVLFLSACGSDELPLASNPEPEYCPVQAVEAQTQTDALHSRILVKLKPGRMRALRFLSAGVVSEQLNENLFALEFLRGESIAQVKLLLGESVEFAEVDQLVYSTEISNDELVGRQWAHEVVKSQAEIGRAHV